MYENNRISGTFAGFMIWATILITFAVWVFIWINDDSQFISTQEGRRGTLCGPKERIIHYERLL